MDEQGNNQRKKEVQTWIALYIEQLKTRENEISEIGSWLHTTLLPLLITARNYFHLEKYEEGMKHLQKSTDLLVELQSNQLYSKRFNQSDWYRFVPSNAKNDYQWIECNSEADPNLYDMDYKIVALSILELLLQDAGQKIMVDCDEYGIEVTFSSPIQYAENTLHLLSSFHCKFTQQKLHIPLLGLDS
ncbi:MAG: hypothetical protein CL840_02120 [Crocinitomicaceae bacterium]|nr:hypothetical protein [Crocinitomicaceae bacterium]|tara:strand:+ start:5108 stop:5671 length:564 start_codon:yes stop_codon:yes gene_type:complete